MYIIFFVIINWKGNQKRCAKGKRKKEINDVCKSTNILWVDLVGPGENRQLFWWEQEIELKKGWEVDVDVRRWSEGDGRTVLGGRKKKKRKRKKGVRVWKYESRIVWPSIPKLPTVRGHHIPQANPRSL